MEIKRILGKKERTTIPFPIRHLLGYQKGDVVSFEIVGENVVIRKLKLCTDCIGERTETISILFDSLTQQEKFTVLASLSAHYANGKVEE